MELDLDWETPLLKCNLLVILERVFGNQYQHTSPPTQDYASKITHYTIGSFLAHRSPVLFLPQESAMLLVSMNVVHVLLVTIDNHGVVVRC